MTSRAEIDTLRKEWFREGAESKLSELGELRLHAQGRLEAKDTTLGKPRIDATLSTDEDGNLVVRLGSFERLDFWASVTVPRDQARKLLSSDRDTDP